ncbi:hypothetical protein [Persicirhabdus sediminis]|uniref:Uncharacterized protein n=1 Tax=Persicirhabdus sediminis TaxID=454144 RepID=A0A8J7MFP9_9BACT|nr:hypothetical protein [Persicirhabdus sediminis]MBK1791945.1 hypothetical protein [Persicirhabdus sediminis]
MNHPHLIGLLVGGVLPAFLFGLANLFQKSAGNHPISIGIYLIMISIGVAIVGAVIAITGDKQNISLAAALPSIGVGLFWAAGVAFVFVGLRHYGAPISKLAPLYNLNTLVTIAFALFIFSEWKDTNFPSLISGSFFLILGGVLISK